MMREISQMAEADEEHVQHGLLQQGVEENRGRVEGQREAGDEPDPF